MAGYVVRSPVRWGKPDGSVVDLVPGDSLPSEMTEDQRNELLAAGSVVPSDTHKALEDHDEQVKKLQEKRAELDAEQGALYAKEGEMQAEAAAKVEEAKTPPEPKSAPKAEPKPSYESKSATQTKAEQAQQKADTRGTPSEAKK